MVKATNEQINQMKKLEFAMKVQDEILGEIISAQENNPKIRINYTKSNVADKFFDKAYNEQTTENFKLATRTRDEAIKDLLSQCKTKGIDLSSATMAQDYLSKSSQSYKPQQTPHGVNGTNQSNISK